MKYPLFKRKDKVKHPEFKEVSYFIVDMVYKERPYVKILGNPIKEPHYDLIHPSKEYKGKVPRFVPESKLKQFKG